MLLALGRSGACYEHQCITQQPSVVSLPTCSWDIYVAHCVAVLAPSDSLDSLLTITGASCRVGGSCRARSRPASGEDQAHLGGIWKLHVGPGPESLASVALLETCFFCTASSGLSIDI